MYYSPTTSHHIFETYEGPQVWLETLFEGETDEGDVIRLRPGMPGGFGLKWNKLADNSTDVAMHSRWAKLMEIIKDRGMDTMTSEQLNTVVQTFQWFMARDHKHFLRVWEQRIRGT